MSEPRDLYDILTGQDNLDAEDDLDVELDYDAYDKFIEKLREDD